MTSMTVAPVDQQGREISPAKMPAAQVMKFQSAIKTSELATHAIFGVKFNRTRHTVEIAQRRAMTAGPCERTDEQ